MPEILYEKPKVTFMKALILVDEFIPKGNTGNKLYKNHYEELR